MRAIPIHLSDVELAELMEMKTGQSLRKHVRDRIDVLILSHRGKRSKEIADFLGIDTDTVSLIRKRYREGKIQRAVYDAPRPGQPKKYTIAHETKLTALACSEAPKGWERWTLELLTETMQKKVAGCKGINRETVRLMLKKMNVSRGNTVCGALGR